MKRLVIASVVTCVYLLGVATHAEPVSPDPIRYIAGTCANCHGISGRSIGAMPSLAGRPKTYLAEEMRRFRDGKRPATVMQQLAKGYTDEQIDRLSEYFADQPAR